MRYQDRHVIVTGGTGANPWLLIALSDYEQHMKLPTVGQAQMLSDELAAAVAAHRPTSLAVIGCAGGNGFDRLTSCVLERVVGIDVNPHFLDVARTRYSKAIPGLELHLANIESDLAAVCTVDLVFVGLVLEYVDVTKAMGTLHRLCNDDAIVVIVLQQPHSVASAVSPSPYTSLQSLSSSMRLRDPGVVTQIGEAVGLVRESVRTLVLPSGKEFAVLTLRRCGHCPKSTSTVDP